MQWIFGQQTICSAGTASRIKFSKVNTAEAEGFEPVVSLRTQGFRDLAV